MTIQKIHSRNPDLYEFVTMERVEQCLKELRDFLGQYFHRLIPSNRDYLYEIEFFKYYYLASALNNLKSSKGFQIHIQEYNNNPDTAFFVTLIADILLAHNLKVTLEPDIPGHPKKPDIYAEQNEVGIYFECKNPIDPDQGKLLREQQKIFDYLSDIISNDYSLACFYEQDLTDAELAELRLLLENSLSSDSNIYEDKILLESEQLKVKIIVSGVTKNIEKDSVFAITGLPVFNTGYCYVNGINHYGKNIVFYKKSSKNTIRGQIKNSYNKVPKSMPYIVVINLSGPRFDPEHYTEMVAERFNRKDDTSISGILFIQHSFDEEGNMVVNMKCVHNPNAVVVLEWIEDFLSKNIIKKMF